MSKVLTLAMSKEAKRNGGMREVTDAAKVIELNRDIRSLNGAVLEPNEIITFDKEHCRLGEASVGSGAKMLVLLCVTNKNRTITFWPSSVYKSRTSWDAEAEKPGARIDNYDGNPVGDFYSKCPNQVIFLACMMGHSIRATECGPRVQVAGWDTVANAPSEDPNETSFTRFNKFSFVGQPLTVNDIPDEYLSDNGTQIAAEALIAYFKDAE